MGTTDYFIRDCPKKKKDDKREDKRDDNSDDKKNDKKKAMLTTWSNSDTTNESENNSDDLCLMAREDSIKDSETLIEVTWCKTKTECGLCYARINVESIPRPITHAQS